MADRPHIYVDSCCFIDVARQAIGTLPTARARDVWHLWKLMEAHKDKDVTLMTSVLTVAECTHADGNMDDRVRNMFSRLLMSGEHVVMVQPTPFIAADARDLRWKSGITLRGMDGLHVAAALDRKCREFLTTDAKILNESSKIERLGTHVVTPENTSLLPERFRQTDLLDGNVTPLPRAASGGTRKEPD